MICSRKERRKTNDWFGSKKTATMPSPSAEAAAIMLKKHFVSLLLDGVTVSLS